MPLVQRQRLLRFHSQSIIQPTLRHVKLQFAVDQVQPVPKLFRRILATRENRPSRRRWLHPQRHGELI